RGDYAGAGREAVEDRGARRHPGREAGGVAALELADDAFERLGGGRAVANVLVVAALAVGGREVERGGDRVAGGRARASFDADRLGVSVHPASDPTGRRALGPTGPGRP